MKKLIFTLFASVLCALNLNAQSITPGTGNILYVNAAVTGGNGSGGSWTNAIPSLANALHYARVNAANWSADSLRIFVAKGTYYPSYRADYGSLAVNNRDAAFVMVNNVQIYGGFDPANSINDLTDTRIFDNTGSILSGDIGDVGNSNDNAYHVVISAGDVGNALIDGFSIVKGNANGSVDISVNGEGIYQPYGGGMYNSSSSPTIANIIISGNTAIGGGGMQNSSSSPTITNTTISGNTVTYSGGGMENSSSSPTITNTIITGNTANDGGGMYNYSSSPTITNTTISGNTANTGGGMNNDGSSSPTITNTIISGNTANVSGGGMYNYSSSPSVTNTTINGNTADTGGGMVNSSSSSPNITNTTISGNTANTGGGMYNYSSSPILYNSILLGNKTGIYGDAINASSAHNLIQTGNETSGGALDGTPLNHSTPGNIFVQPITPGLSTAGDFSLQFGSAAVDAGDNALYTNARGDLANDVDLAGNARVYDYANGGVVDLGAFEFQAALTTPSTAKILYVDAAVSGGNGSGDSWTNAIFSLADALHYARVNAANWADDSLRIFVAKGTYYPSYRADDSSLAVNNRDAAFVMVKNVQIYGGFAPANSIDELTDTRIFDHTGSILSGDIGGGGNSSDNAYHVVISADDIGNARIDGFSIIKGNADGTGNITVNGETVNQGYGGGMANYNHSSPVITNATISGNTASFGGGGMFNSLNSSPVITNATLTGNTTTNNGGGMFNYDYSSPVITNTTISENSATYYGGGMYNFSYSSPRITNNTISSNTAFSGGGFFNTSSSPTITNTTISGNTASNGGGIFNYSASPVIINATISGNSASADGGGMYNYNSSSTPTLYNSILLGNNTGIVGTAINTSSAHNLIQTGDESSGGALDGTTVNHSAPSNIFVQPITPGLSTAGDFSLNFASAAVDAGDNALYTNAGGDLANDVDLAGNARVYFQANGGVIDLGAYEFQAALTTPSTVNILYVDAAATGGNGSGDSWTNAIPSLANALHYARVNAANWTADSLRIFVAKGTYYPSYRADDSRLAVNDRDAAFVMVKNVQIYGGFDPANSIDDLTDTRIFDNKGSILSGDIGNVGNSNDNAYHVVIMADAIGNARIDGFSIVKGNADGTGSITVNGQPLNQNNGGGIINYFSSSPLITNATISGNSANYGGGIFNYSSSPVITNATISGNTVANNGGGVYNNKSSPAITNVTISGNTATNGGGMYNVNSSTPTLYNSIILGNNTGIVGNAINTSSAHNLIQTGDETSGGALDGTPLNNSTPINIFVQSITPGLSTAGDFSLKSNSAAVDAGDNALYSGDLANDNDLAGNTRVYNYANGGVIDLGAYEFQGNALPVTLINFIGALRKGVAQLQWSTGVESHLKHFEIQKSLNGLSYKILGTISAKGSNCTYSYNAPQLEATAYYRLKMVDDDGNIQFSTTLTLSQSGTSDILVYPNPAKDYIHIKMENAGTIRIYNASGALVKTQTVQSGLNTIHVSQLSTGMYYLILDGKNVKFIKL